MKKNQFLTFIFSLFPGCGQMYQGYMKRGFSLMAWFFGIIGVSVITRIYALNFMLVVVWAYSFFDSFNIHALSDAQRAAFFDEFIPNQAWLQKHNMGGLFKNARLGKIVGWGCVILGLFMIYQSLYQSLYQNLGYLFDRFPFIYHLFDVLPTLLVAAVVIILGVWMLRRKKPSSTDDEIPPFEGGENNG